MRPIIFLVIAVGIGSAIAGSIILQFFAQADNTPQQMDLEKKCEKIASEGFKIQVKYSEIDFDKMPKEDADALKYLDDLWIKDCVSQLSPETLFNIADRVERDYYSGE